MSTYDARCVIYSSVAVYGFMLTYYCLYIYIYRIPYPPPTTVILKGQMNCGGYLQIDENGVLSVLDNPPNDRNQCKKINDT